MEAPTSRRLSFPALRSDGLRPSLVEPISVMISCRSVTLSRNECPFSFPGFESIGSFAVVRP